MARSPAPRISIAPLLVTGLVTGLVAGLATGCKTELEAEAIPDADLGRGRSYFVAKNEKDKHDLELLVRDELRRWGRTTTAGPVAEMPDDADVLVTYSDKWYWDITPYLVSLDVRFRDPETESVIASGRTMRTSLVRKSPAFMTHEVMTKILSTTNPDETPPVFDEEEDGKGDEESGTTDAPQP